jgi:hypothetical protein
VAVERSAFWSAFEVYARDRGFAARWNRRTGLRRNEGSVAWSIRVRKTSGEAELLIEQNGRDENQALFEQLKGAEPSLSRAAGFPLRWDALDDRIRFRVAAPTRSASIPDRGSWHSTWDQLLGDMRALEAAIRPVLPYRATFRALPYDAPEWNVGELLAGSAAHDWDFQAGDLVRRTELHDRFGGSRQGGIGPSRQSPNVFVFSDPTTGAKYGYNDRWESGPVFHYTGEGQVGDQKMTGGNLAILRHAEDGRALRLFKGVRGVVRYEGEFILDAEVPSYIGHAPDRNGSIREVIIFRMRPAGGKYPLPAPTYMSFGAPSNVVSEDTSIAPAEPFAVDPNKIDRGTRGHNRTQNLLRSFLEDKGIKTLQPTTEGPDFDLGWVYRGTWFVAEVKSLTLANETKQLRLALGQVLDYQDILSRRHTNVRAVIAVETPIRDRRWVALCEGHGVILVWPETFEATLSKVLTS